jgi:hypothetical protein
MVLLDVELPDLSGFELCTRIRASARLGAVPIFMLTGRGDVDAKGEAFRAGADDYLVKPVVPEELVPRVVRALERSHGAHARPAPPKEPAAPARAAQSEPQPAALAPLAPASAASPVVAPPTMTSSAGDGLPASLRPRPADPATRPGEALLKGKPAPAEPARAEPAPTAPRNDAWSKFLGRSRPQ